MTRSPILLYGLLFISEAVLNALVPLTPSFQVQFGLSSLEAGLLLAAAALATVVVSVPAGYLCDRVGARRLTSSQAG